MIVKYIGKYTKHLDTLVVFDFPTSSGNHRFFPSRHNMLIFYFSIQATKLQETCQKPDPMEMGRRSLRIVVNGRKCCFLFFLNDFFLDQDCKLLVLHVLILLLGSMKV